jgi:hypothetical protein
MADPSSAAMRCKAFRSRKAYTVRSEGRSAGSVTRPPASVRGCTLITAPR